MLGEKGQPLEPAIIHRWRLAWRRDEYAENTLPPCFPTRASFVLWLNSWSPSKDPDVDFCTDCTAQRRDAMRAQGRCAFPDTTFDVDTDGWTRGNRK